MLQITFHTVLSAAILLESWLEIEDIMAAKHAQITEFKYGGCIRLSVGKLWKSDTVIFWKRVLKMPSSEMY